MGVHKCHTEHLTTASTGMNTKPLYVIEERLGSVPQRPSMYLLLVGRWCLHYGAPLRLVTGWQVSHRLQHALQACYLMRTWAFMNVYGGKREGMIDIWDCIECECDAPSCLSWAVCPVISNEPCFKISHCLEDATVASLLLCFCQYLRVSPPHSSPLVRLQAHLLTWLITPVTPHLPEELSLTTSLYTFCLAISPPRGTCHIFKVALML